MDQSSLLSLTNGRLLHGGDYNPEQWLHAPDVLAQDLDLMRRSGCHAFSVGIFAWAALEPSDGRFDFGWLDDTLDRLHAAGCSVFLATPTGSIPRWLHALHPEVRRVDASGTRQHNGNRHNHCWSSPILREHVHSIVHRLGERYRHHPAVRLWHVSNEYNGACYCDHCLAAFRSWLERRHGSLDNLNRHYWSSFWGLRFTHWDQVDPRTGGLDGLSLDWARFTSDQVAAFYAFEVETLRAAGVRQPATTNLMGWHASFDPRSLRPHLDVVADDFYPGYDADSPGLPDAAVASSLRFDYMRCLRGAPAPWFLMESCIDGRQLWSSIKLKPPGFHQLEMFQALAHGAAGTLYFQWRKGLGGVEKFHGAVVGHSHPTRSRAFREVEALSARYARLDALLPSLNRARVALLIDMQSRWAYQAALGLPDRQDEGILPHTATALYKPFWQRGITVDVLASTDDFSACRVVLAPRLFLLLPGVAGRLADFVASGGHLLLTHLSGMVDEHGLCFTDGCPGGGLQELAGVFVDETDQRAPGESRAVTATSPLLASPGWRTTRTCSFIEVDDASVLATYADGWAAGRPALTRRTHGSGTVWFAAADFDDAGCDALAGAIIAAVGLTSATGSTSPLPPGVTAQLRHGPDANWLFLLNFSTAPASIPLPDHWTDAESPTPTPPPLATVPPLSARVFRAPASAP